MNVGKEAEKITKEYLEKDLGLVATKASRGTGYDFETNDGRVWEAKGTTYSRIQINFTSTALKGIHRNPTWNLIVVTDIDSQPKLHHLSRDTVLAEGHLNVGFWVQLTAKQLEQLSEEEGSLED